MDGEEEEVKVRFTNLSDEPLNLTVFHLTSSWGIVQIYPVKSDFETVDKRDSRTRDITLKRTKQATSGVDVMKAFVTIEPTSFRILEMPEIDINTIGKASGIWVSNGTLPARIAHGHRTPEPRSPNQWRTGDIQSATMALLTSVGDPDSLLPCLGVPVTDRERNEWPVSWYEVWLALRGSDMGDLSKLLVCTYYHSNWGVVFFPRVKNRSHMYSQDQDNPYTPYYIVRGELVLNILLGTWPCASHVE